MLGLAGSDGWVAVAATPLPMRGGKRCATRRGAAAERGVPCNSTAASATPPAAGKTAQPPVARTARARTAACTIASRREPAEAQPPPRTSRREPATLNPRTGACRGECLTEPSAVPKLFSVSRPSTPRAGSRPRPPHDRDRGLPEAPPVRTEVRRPVTITTAATHQEEPFEAQPRPRTTLTPTLTPGQRAANRARAHGPHLGPAPSA